MLVTDAVAAAGAPAGKYALGGQIIVSDGESARLADGTLAVVLPSCEVPDRPLYALHAPGSQTTARVRLFLDFVSGWFRRQVPASPSVTPPAQAKSA